VDAGREVFHPPLFNVRAAVAILTLWPWRAWGGARGRRAPVPRAVAPSQIPRCREPLEFGDELQPVYEKGPAALGTTEAIEQFDGASLSSAAREFAELHQAVPAQQ
jgi:hypothetical protein